MKKIIALATWLGCLLAAPSLFSAPAYLNATLTTLNGSWSPTNGTLSFSANGMQSSSSGSIITSIDPSGPNQGTAGPYEYEIRTTYRLTQSGGDYVTYFRATSNALLNPNPLGTSTGTFYALVLHNPIFSGGVCTADLQVVKVVNGTRTDLSGGTTGCRDNMTLRVVVRNSVIYIFKDEWDGCCFYVNDMSLTTGRAGVGVATPAPGNGIYRVEMNYADTTAPPQPPTPGVSAFDNRVEMQWPGAGDGVNGSGLFLYQLLRRTLPSGGWALLASHRRPDLVDNSVTAGTAYEYQIVAVDYHHNHSAATTFAVTTAPAGTTDPRRIGVRPDGVYWGGAGEQIDVISGNLNFSSTLVTARARGGMSVPFRLQYNSQIWRKDSGGIWKLTRDTGFGHGWRLMAGSITAVYNHVWSISHYIYTDSTGAQYRMSHAGNNVWSSNEGIYVTWDVNTQRLWFHDGSFWYMGSQAGPLEEDAGTLYPTLMQDSNGNRLS